MRRAPSCLLLAGFLVALNLILPEAASAQAGVRHGTSAPPGHGWSKPRPRVAPRHYRPHHHRLHTGRYMRRHVHGFGPRWPRYWPYVDTVRHDPVFVEAGLEPVPQRLLPGIPSVADLPASTGIVSPPSAAPTIYVLDGGKRSLRRGGAKVLTMDSEQAETEPGRGPRIIRLNVPRR